MPSLSFSSRLLLALSLMASLASPLRALDLPVRDPRLEPLEPGCYRGDRLEIRLTWAASTRAFDTIAGISPRRLAGEGRAAFASLGLDALDRAGVALGGVTFEPEFRGERPADPGSRDPDLSAFYIVHLPPGLPLERALATFAALPEIESATPIAILPVDAVPNDSLWADSWWFYQPSRKDIRAPEAWDITTGDTSVVVAVLDTGVLPYHPDLGGVIPGLPGQLWTNWAEKSGIAGVDDDGNGYVDDVWGWDFVDTTSTYTPAGEDWADEDNDPNDYAGHGTMVAGVVGALTNNAIGIVGTAWKVRIMPLRMAWSDTRGPLGLVDMTYAARAIHYAWRNGADIINASWASIDQGGLGAAADAAIASGVLIVAAAGNNNQPHELAARNDVVAVAASNSIDQIWAGSNRGAYVDLSAPGQFITSTFVVHTGTDSIGYRTPAYNTLTGTSFASPMVAGAAALLKADRRARGLRPMWPVEQQLRLRETTDDISSLNPSGGFGTGRLNLERLLTDPPTSFAYRTGASQTGAAVVVPAAGGRSRIVSAHTALSRLLMVDAEFGDTIWIAGTPGAPIGQIAAADLGGSRGVGLFVGTTNGLVAGFDGLGMPLPGWPAVTMPGQQPLPALGDLDGDGIPEVVAMSGGDLYAWRVDGSVVQGFPITLGPASTPPTYASLSELDDAPGAEIIVPVGGFVNVLDGQGRIVPGWPYSLGAPIEAKVVVTRIRPYPLPTVLVVAGSELHALARDGTQRYLPRPLGGTVIAEPALGDFDGDGWDDLLVPLDTPALAVFDSLGFPLTALNWPYTLTTAAVGYPVIGPLSRFANVVLASVGGQLIAVDAGAQPLASFPKPGAPGPWVTLAELDSDLRTEVVAGTDGSGLAYVYDAGPGSWNGVPAWPTARGNFARTGSRIYAPSLPASVDPRPAPVMDLAAALGPAGATLTFTATGEDSLIGDASSFEVRGATTHLDEAGFDAAPIRLTVSGATAGTNVSVPVPSVAPGVRHWFAVKAKDRGGQLSAISNIATVGAGPLEGKSGIALAPRAQPSRIPVEFLWQGPGGPPAGPQEIRIYDLQGRLVRRLPLPAEVAGAMSWDARNEKGRVVEAGIYFARLLSGSFHAQARVVLLP